MKFFENKIFFAFFIGNNNYSTVMNECIKNERDKLKRKMWIFVIKKNEFKDG